MSDVRRILVVDDETIIVEFLENLLRSGKRRYQIETAVDGRRAIDKARQFQPHLVVLDINIPVVDGFEVCESILREQAAAPPNVLAITADLNPERLRRIRAAGASECLSKPFSLNDFIARVESLTEDAFARADNGSPEPES